MRKICPLAVRLTKEDRETIEQVSLREGKGASTWMREIILGHLVKIGKKKSKGPYRDYRR